MSNDKIGDQIANVAVDAAQSGKRIFAQPNTPIEKLVTGVSHMQLKHDHMVGLGQSEVAGYVQAAATGVGQEVNPIEDNAFDQYTTQIAGYVQTHISYAKGTIVPLVLELQKLVEEDIEKPDSLIDRFDIQVVDLPEPMQNAGLRKTVESLSGGIFGNPEENITAPVPAPGALIEALQTGSSEYDASITAWANRLGDVKLSEMWTNIFGGTKSRHLVDNFSGRDGADYALFVYLAATRLKESAPEGVQLTLSQLKRLAQQYIDAAAVRLNQEYESNDRNARVKMLVLSSDERTSTVRVNGDIYREYLAAGGKNEVILGGLLTSSLAKSLGDVQARSSSYQVAFDRAQAINNANRKNRIFSTFVRALSYNFATLLDQAPGNEEQAAWNTNNLNPQVLIARAQTVIENLTSGDLNDIHKTCIKVICGGRFFYTDAECFLTLMNDIAKENPNLDIREAGLVATIQMVADYVSDQILVRGNV